MARNSAAALARAELEAAERETRAENDDLNEAIGRTDSEIFTEAMGDEPIGEDENTALEEMGEGLEGDDLEDEQPAEEDEQASDQQELQQQPEDQGPPPRTEPPQRQQQQRPDQPFIPPRVLRETRERFREQEGFLNQQIGTLVEQNRQLMDELRAMRSQPQPQRQQQQPQQQPQQQQPPQRPDRWADEEGYERWQFERNQQMMREELDRRFNAMREEQQAQSMRQLDAALQQTAMSPRGYEFSVAYRDLMGLDRNQQNADLVRRLIASPDPGAAILEWWESSSNPDYVEYHRDQIRQTYGVSAAPQMNGRRGGYQRPYQQQQPRHEFRLPRSLSDATGASSQHMTDPEMFDSSEASVFAYGSRR